MHPHQFLSLDDMSPKLLSVAYMSLPQVDDVFASGDLGEALKAVEAMEAAGLEAADARDKLTRITTAVKKVRQCPPLTLANKTVLDRQVLLILLLILCMVFHSL